MEYTVYVSSPDIGALVLTPTCMRPSLAVERRLGPLRRSLVVEADPAVIGSLADVQEPGTCELVFAATHAQRRLRTLLPQVGHLVA